MFSGIHEKLCVVTMVGRNRVGDPLVCFFSSAPVDLGKSGTSKKRLNSPNQTRIMIAALRAIRTMHVPLSGSTQVPKPPNSDDWWHHSESALAREKGAFDLAPGDTADEALPQTSRGRARHEMVCAASSPP